MEERYLIIQIQLKKKEMVNNILGINMWKRN